MVCIRIEDCFWYFVSNLQFRTKNITINPKFFSTPSLTVFCTWILSLPTLETASEGITSWAALSYCKGRLMIQLLCVWVCARWHGYNWRWLLKLDTLQCYGDTSGLQRAIKLLPRPHSCDFPWFEPCPRPWRRGRTTGLTKSMRVSFAGMRRGSWGWSWRAARRMDSSRLSASFPRAERSATAANSTRMNSCWKSMIPRWLDSPPGTSMLWSNTAKIPSDLSVSNKVSFLEQLFRMS